PSSLSLLLRSTLPRPPRFPLFPYTTLFRSLLLAYPLFRLLGCEAPVVITDNKGLLAAAGLLVGFGTYIGNGCTSGHGVCGMGRLDRKSTRLNSSHVKISYAVFCLKKKT